jgi:hypothetical protein
MAFSSHAHSLVDRVGKQALFSSVDRIGEPFAGKFAIIEDREAAAVKRERAGVREPQRLSGTGWLAL